MSDSNSNSPERGEDGCVICTETAECPVCAEDEYCMMTAMTCDRCPITYCAKKSVTASLAVLNNLTDVTSANHSATNQHPGNQISNDNTQKTNGSVNPNGQKGSSGGGVGGVIAGLVIGLAVIGFITYKWYWKRRKLRGMDRELDESLKEEGEISTDSSGTFDETNEPIFDSIDNNKYNDGVRHNDMRNPGLFEQYNGIKNFQTSFMQPNLTNLNVSGFPGAADTASVRSSETDASSLLPIAYIPGVTSGGPPRSRSTPTAGTSLYSLTIPGNVASHITLGSSVLGNIDEADEDSILQPPDVTTMNAMYRPSPQFSAESRFTTAMRAKPKLVQIDNNGSTESILKEASSSNHL